MTDVIPSEGLGTQSLKNNVLIVLQVNFTMKVKLIAANSMFLHLFKCLDQAGRPIWSSGHNFTSNDDVLIAARVMKQNKNTPQVRYENNTFPCTTNSLPIASNVIVFIRWIKRLIRSSFHCGHQPRCECLRAIHIIIEVVRRCHHAFAFFLVFWPGDGLTVGRTIATTLKKKWKKGKMK